MSFLAKLVLGSTEFNVLSADYEITQSTDSQNRPNGKPKGGIINVTVEASNKNDLAEWVLSPTMKKSGQLTFYRRDANSSMKTVAFSDAFCVSYKEEFEAKDTDPMTTKIRISAGELKINNVSVTNPWSSMAARIKDVGEKLGLSNIMDGPGGAIGDLAKDIGSNETIQEIGRNAKEGYDVVSKNASLAYNTGKQAVDTAKGAKNDAQAMRDQTKEKIAETKNDIEEKRKDAEGEITSFLP